MKTLPITPLTTTILVSSAAALLLTLSPARADIFDLADVVGNGNGLGTGTVDSGYGQHTGNYFTGVTSSDNTIPADNNVFHQILTSVNSDPFGFLDGIFVPDGNVGGGPITVQLTSTGLSAAVPDTGGQSWQNGITYNSACCPGNTSVFIGGVDTDFTTGGRTMISFHANVGVTFDLDAIRTATGQTITDFSAIVGQADPAGSSAFTAYLDGVVAFPTTNTNGNADAINVSVPIGSQRFLTLLGTDQNLTYGNDGQLVGNPRLTIVPEPGSVGLLAAAGLGLLARRRRSCRS